MSSRHLILSCTALLFAIGCARKEGGYSEPLPFGEDFESAGYAGASRGPTADAGAAAAPNEGDSGGERTVEEADLYRIVDERLYVLNSYRGLFVFDIHDPDHPIELGRMPLVGQPMEMYIRGDRAYAILSDYFTYDASAFEDAGLSPYYGSRIVAIDLSDPVSPETIGDVRLDGYIADTRLVGDVIYAVANRYSWWRAYGLPQSETQDLTILTSIDVSNPRAIHEVEQLQLAGTGYFVHASSEAFVIAGNANEPSGWGTATELRYIDISDPAGHIVARASVRVSGSIADDSALHIHENQIRLLTREADGITTRVRIFDGSQPDTLPVLGELAYEYAGRVFGTTFTADRLYMIHYMTVDPLEIVDLSDPTRPTITGILEMPGWVERIAVSDNRLIGLGVDDTEGRRTSLTLFDVSDPTAPVLLARDSVEADWSWSAATWERKAWNVDWNEGLVLFPYSGYSNDDSHPYGNYRNALSIVEIGEASLTRRGTLEASAPVERGFFHRGRVYALSQAALQVVDVRDRERPVAGDTIELVRSVSDFVRTDRASLELVQPGISWGWYGGNGSELPQIRVTDPSNSENELSRIELPRGAERIVAVSNEVALAIGNGNRYYGFDRGGDSTAIGAGIAVLDVSDPSAARIAADIPFSESSSTISGAVDGGYVSSYSDWETSYGRAYGVRASGEPILRFPGNRIGLIRNVVINCSGLAACRSAGIEPVTTGERVSDDSAYGSRYENELVLIDLSDPSHPTSITASLEDGQIEHPFVDDGELFFSRARPSRIDESGRSWIRWYFERWSTSGDVVARARINVPGVVVDARFNQAITVEQQWTPEGYMRTVLNGVEISRERATRRSELVLSDNGWMGGVVVDGTSGFALTHGSSAEWPASGTTESILTTFDLTDVSNLRVAARQRLGQSAWSIEALTPSTLAIAGGYGGGLALFARNPDRTVSFRSYARTYGWSTQVSFYEDTLYLASGPYGVQAIPLEP